jgi:hypothetical protein
MTPEQIADLKAISYKTGASVAWQIRQAVGEYLLKAKKRR